MRTILPERQGAVVAVLQNREMVSCEWNDGREGNVVGERARLGRNSVRPRAEFKR